MAHTRNGRRARQARQESAKQRWKDALVAAQVLLPEVEEVDSPVKVPELLKLKDSK
jgi:hypothetical protein